MRIFPVIVHGTIETVRYAGAVVCDFPTIADYIVKTLNLEYLERSLWYKVTTMLL